jgi:hypothetical protein
MAIGVWLPVAAKALQERRILGEAVAIKTHQYEYKISVIS